LTFGTVVPDSTLQVTVTGDGSQPFAGGKLSFTGDTTSFQITDYDGDPEDSPFTCETGDYYFAMTGAGAVTFTFATRVTDQTAKSMTINVNSADGSLDDTVVATATIICAEQDLWCDQDLDGQRAEYATTTECDPGVPYVWANANAIDGKTDWGVEHLCIFRAGNDPESNSDCDDTVPNQGICDTGCDGC
jgi:hypothetical protein